MACHATDARLEGTASRAQENAYEYEAAAKPRSLGRLTETAMKKVYDAANGVDAHIVLHMLEQAGIAGRIDGEYLTGAIGELPPTGLVRVLVDEADAEEARAII